MHRVLVVNLPPDIRIKDIDDFFSPFGKITYINVDHRSDPLRACVQFDSPRDASDAVKYRHGCNYEGYTLQVILMENELRAIRDSTPPPPPPPMVRDYSSKIGVDVSRNEFSGNNMMVRNLPNLLPSGYQTDGSQWSNNNWQQNMFNCPSNNVSNMQLQTVKSFSLNEHSSVYSDSNNTNMLQLNMANFRDTNSYVREENTMQHPNPHLVCDNDMGTRINVERSQDINVSNNNNAINDPYTTPGVQNLYTRDLSGCGRRWFHRYIRKGYSPQMAREKALEHRTLPYLRGERNKNPVDSPTNVALETIGNTIMSLLSSNDSQMMPTTSNWEDNNSSGGSNFNMFGPSSFNAYEPTNQNGGSVRAEPSVKGSTVSKRQYLKSLDALKSFQKNGCKNSNDRLSKRYHIQIVKEFKKNLKEFKIGATRSSSSEEKSYTKLLVAYKKKKQELFNKAKQIPNNPFKKQSGAFRKRFRMLVDDAKFSESEARVLAVHPKEKLQVLLSMKEAYENALKNKQEFLAINNTTANTKSVSYRNDVTYLKIYEEQSLENLNDRTKVALRACILRTHEYEKSKNLPLTKTKFLSLLTSKTDQNERPTQNNKSLETTNNQVVWSNN